MSECYQCPHNWGIHVVSQELRTITCPEDGCDCLTALPDPIKVMMPPWSSYEGRIDSTERNVGFMPWPEPVVLKLSRELMHLTAESAASAAVKKYVEEVFSQQFPGKKLQLGADITFDMIDMGGLVFNIPGVDVQIED